MDNLKVCFIGLGSIAKRHIANLHTIAQAEGFSLHVDCVRSSNKTLPPELAGQIRAVYGAAADVPDDYDAIFITNPTHLHIDSVKTYASKGKAFFIEKPICSFDQHPEELNKIPLLKEKILYVACPLRYTNVIQYLKSQIDFSKVWSVRCISSSFLPQWRAGIDYRDTYSAHKNMGGGVSIDLIHEWDYLHYLLGKPDSIKSYIRTISNLEIDSDDIAVYMAEYPDKIVELHLDYFGRKTMREIELFTKDDTIVADLIHSTIRYKKSGQIIDLSEQRNDFQIKELQYFLQIIRGTAPNTNTIQTAAEVLKLTGGQE